MDRLGFNSGNSGILESTQEYSGMSQGLYGNDLGMTREYLGDSGRVWDMTISHDGVNASVGCLEDGGHGVQWWRSRK